MAKLSYKENRAFARAVRIIGGIPYCPAKVVEKLGVSKAQISYYKTGKSRISVELAKKIEKLTGGEITVADLNPTSLREFRKSTGVRAGRESNPDTQNYYRVGDINVSYKYWVAAGH